MIAPKGYLTSDDPNQYTPARTMATMRLDKLYDLKGRIALVTGGGTGIGWMIARGLAVNGVKVYITGRRMDVLEKAAQSFAQEGTVIP